MVVIDDGVPFGEGRLRGDGVRVVPEEFARAFHPATLYLYEWTDYWVEYPGADRLRVGEGWCEPVGGSVFPVRFENQLGLALLRAFCGAAALHPPVWVEVISRKFGSPEEHLAFYGALLEDLFDRAARLPFTVAADTGRAVAESVRPPTPLFALYFLAQYADELVAAVGTVLAAPHVQLLDREEYVPLADAGEADADVLLGILRSPEEWAPARGFALAEKLRGYAPARVWQRLPEETFDTPENRFARAFLRELLAAAEGLPDRRWWGSVPAGRKAVVGDLTHALRRAVGHGMFAEVGQVERLPTSSRVLLRREGYRDLLRLWRLYNAARRPLFEPLREAMDVRDVATLYEMWASFRLVEEIAGITGEEPALELYASDSEGLRWGSRARFGGAGAPVYNRSFGRASGDSYSVTLRPDFTWERDGKAEVVLDAKFRLDRPTLDAGDDAEVSGGTTTATVKQADLYKMHTYRDALGVRAAVTVYPGTEPVFYDRLHGRGADVTLRDVLCGDCSGIGALPMRPARG